MKKILFLILFTYPLINYGQDLIDVTVIYSSKDIIIFDNGDKFKVQTTTPFYAVTDSSIDQFIQKDDDFLRLNRVLSIKNNNERIELMEYIKEKMVIYRYRSSKYKKQ